MFGKQKGLDDVMKAAMISMLAGNTTEHVEVNTHTQARVPLLQAVLLMVAIAALLAGAWLLLTGGALAFTTEIDSSWDMLLGVCIFWALVITWIAIGDRIISPDRIKTPWLRRMLLAFFAFIGTVAMLDSARAIADGFDKVAGLKMLTGFALISGSALLIWRFANELINPLYPRPPSIDLMRDMMQPAPTGPQVVKVPTPVHRNGNHVADLDDDEEEDAEEDTDGYVTDHELLMEFVERAAVIGLQRARWLDPRAPEYLAKREVTRGIYNRMIALAGRWHIVRPGGGGSPAQWNMDAEDGLEMLRLAWESVHG